MSWLGTFSSPLFNSRRVFQSVCKETTKQNPNLKLRRQPSVLATAAASYFYGLMRRESKSKMSKKMSGGRFVNPMVSSGTTEGELQMADRSETTKTKDRDTSMIITARDCVSEKGSNEGHHHFPSIGKPLRTMCRVITITIITRLVSRSGKRQFE